MAAPGSYPNASQLPCWETCGSCYRCKDKGRYTKCNKCSGRHDPFGRHGPDLDDYCDCVNNKLRWRTQEGQLIITPFKKNPFEGEIVMEKKTSDEADWDAYVNDLREKMQNPEFTPIYLEEIDRRRPDHFREIES